MNNYSQRKVSFQNSLKSLDTEEWLDLHFTRPCGLLWARFFNKLNVHPNVVTIISIFLGIGAAYCFYFNNLKINILGILLLIWANIYDSCDGQMARMTGKKTRLGRVLDGFAGDVWFTCIYLAIIFRLWSTWRIWIFVLCAIAGLWCHADQCALADYYRNIHLFFIKGKKGSEMDNSRQLTDDFKNTKFKEAPIWKIFLFFYRGYTKKQERLTPQFQNLKDTLFLHYPDGNIPQYIRDDFRKGSLPLMPMTNILTFNTRAITLYISILIGQPWVYPTVEILVLTPLYFYMRWRHERLCLLLQQKYN